MLRERKRTHRVPELNTTSTADISFMLLTFFLVTTSMDSDNGMSRQLPPIPQQKEQAVQEVKRRNVLIIGIGADNDITCNGKPVEMDALRGCVAEFVDNADNLASLPEKLLRDIPLLGYCSVTANHQIFIQSDRAATYDAYMGVQNAIMEGYNDLRDRLSIKRFGHPYSQCTDEQQKAVEEYYPFHLSEGELETEGGGK